SGSTADCFLVALAAALRSGKVVNIIGVPTSEQTTKRAGELNIPLTTLVKSPRITVTVDGADEISPTLDLIKGAGGALLREKIVAQSSDRLVIIADESKVVAKLGAKHALPVEVAQFAHEATGVFLATLGCTATLRKTPDGSKYITDNGNVIYDCRFAGGIDDPRVLERKLGARAGVVETGLFLGMATLALVANS